jgi:hypothetical protein
LIEMGVVTNVWKGRDEGITITNVMTGTRRLCEHIDENPAVRVAPASYTHALDVIATIPNFVAIKVDLGGQVNAELANGAYLGGWVAKLNLSAVPQPPPADARSSRCPRQPVKVGSAGTSRGSRSSPRHAATSTPS